MTTKIPSELSSVPSISDSGNATAITIDSSERVNIGKTSATTGHPVEIQANTAGQGMGIYGRSSDDFSFLGFYENGANTELSSLRSNSGYLGINTGGTQRLRIDSDGLKFGSDTAAANALDDYEEGVWTPTSVANIDALTNVQGFYTKIGRMVYCLFHASVDPTSTSSGFTLGGLPFTVKQMVTHSGIQGTNAIFSDSALFLCFPLQGGTTLSVELDRPMQGSASSSSASYRGSFMYATDQ
tara:strand:+ start:37 stop:759 length:723 start_codon:yes stop_codon:yes gene_type:complete